jgi:hypothetical protein
VVRSRSGEVGRVPRALRTRTQLATAGLAAARVGSPTRDRDARLQFARRRSQQCRGLETVLAIKGTETRGANADRRRETATDPSMTLVKPPLQFSIRPVLPGSHSLALRRPAAESGGPLGWHDVSARGRDQWMRCGRLCPPNGFVDGARCSSRRSAHALEPTSTGGACGICSIACSGCGSI